MAEDLWSELLAQEELSKAGSVMAKPQQPQWRRNLPQTLGPTAGTAVQSGMDLLDAVLSFANPVENIGGPTSAMLGPIGRATAQTAGSLGGAKRINQAQKKIIKALFRGDPQDLADIVKSDRMLHVQVPGAAGRRGMSKTESDALINKIMEGSFAHIQRSPISETMRVHPRTMRGLHPNKPETMISSGTEGLTDVVKHEGTHFLNTENLFRGMEPPGPDLARFAEALVPFIGQAKYGPRIVGQHMDRGHLITAVDEALSYLSQSGGRAPAATWLHQAIKGRPREGGLAQFNPPTQRLLQEALDAGMRAFPRMMQAPPPAQSAAPASGFVERLRSLLKR